MPAVCPVFRDHASYVLLQSGVHSLDPVSLPPSQQKPEEPGWETHDYSSTGVTTNPFHSQIPINQTQKGMELITELNHVKLSLIWRIN